HSTFVLGLVLFYVAAAFMFARSVRNRAYSAAKRTLIVAVLVSVAAICTPYGLSPLVLTWKIMGMETMMNNVTEWQPPNFRAYPAALIYLVGFVTLITGFGIKLCLARLAILAMATWLGFSYSRGFILFLLVVPFIVARPAAHQVPMLKAQGLDEPNDPVLLFFHRHAGAITVVCCSLAVIATVFAWPFQELEPPASAAPRGAINYVKDANIG